jgi:excinuclease UvrABC ATPase subunit
VQDWPSGGICPKCLGEGQIVGELPVRGLSGNRMTLPEQWLDCDRCDGKGYLEAGPHE